MQNRCLHAKKETREVKIPKLGVFHILAKSSYRKKDVKKKT